MNVLTRPLKTNWDELARTEHTFKSDEFEQYVRAIMFPRESYDMLMKINDISYDNAYYVTPVKPPDYKYVSRKDGFEFFVESKFRAKFQDQIPEWVKFFETKHYQEIDNVTPVLIAVGVGGRPAAPERVFLMPARHLKFVEQYPSVMQKYELRPGRSVGDDFLRRILE